MITRYLLSLSACLGAFAQAAEQPHFLWIISEDNSKHHLKHFDKSGVAMPNMEALARDGVSFEAACSNGAVCSVARSTLISGCYAPRIGAQFHRKQMAVPMPKGLKAFPAYLKEAGYYTTNKKKTDYNLKVNMKETWSGSGNWSGRKEGQPFFHKQTLASSHESSLHFKEAAMKQKPMVEKMSVVQLPAHHPDTAIFRYSYAAYQERMRGIDKQLGALIGALKKDGLYEDTIIFYFGDHGGVLPRSKGYAQETGLAVPLIVRVPKKWQHLIPFEPGSRTDVIVNFMDFGPSLLSAAGLPVAEQFDGKPFLGKGLSVADLGERVGVGYADRFDEKYDLVRTYRKGKMKYTRNFQPYNPDALHNFYRYRQLAYKELREMHEAGELDSVQEQFFEKKPAEALYDLEADPYELNNLAGDSKYADVLEGMRAEHMAYLREKNDLSLYPESYLIESAFQDPVAFGLSRSADISKMLDIANLQLERYTDAREGLVKALKSKKAWERYWGCISAASFGDQAKDLAGAVREVAKKDENRLVRVRAAEYLAMIGDTGAKAVVDEAISSSTDAVELNLILNTAAMLYEFDPKVYQFKLDGSKLKAKSHLIKERVQYLNKGS
ncbi:sulfatase-like hydrolase/transferase [Rubritalea tangerina]|uniref:Sulfatase-like hydrolase/transferase n=1 Tax=Rubritalea tangerina TaxID=430798 RepID=A0ABW4ZET6_9BACT